MSQYIVFLGIVASLTLYLAVAFNAQKARGDQPSDYFLAKGTVDETQFAGAQTAYALQMATVFPFFSFAIQGVWWIGFVNTLFYFFGIALFYFLLPKFGSGSVGIIGGSATIHSAIARFHKAPFLRSATAWMTIVGFMGLALFEITWGARVFKVLIPQNGDAVYYLATFLLSSYLIMYFWIGGQGAAIRADQYQLVLSYAGLHFLAAWVAWHKGVDVGSLAFRPITLIIFIASILMIVLRWRNFRNASVPKILRLANLATIASLIVLIVSIASLPSALLPVIDTASISAIPKSKNFWWAFASVACLPLFFQFADMTNWQRMSALAANKNQSILSEAKSGIAQYLLESPLSWLLPIFIGLCSVQFLVLSPTDNGWDQLLISLLGDASPLGMLVATFVFVGVVAIFMSTADGLLSAVGYAYSFDVHSESRRSVDRAAARGCNLPEREAEEVNQTGRRATSFATVMVVGAFIVVDNVKPGAGDTLIGFFLSFFGPLVALAPSLVVPALTDRTASRFFAASSLGLGALSGLAIGVMALLDPTLYDERIVWLSPIASFGVSWILYIAGLPFGRKLG